MANYINLNILSQAYIHIEPVNLAHSEIEVFQSYISDFVSERGKFFLYPDVQIDVAIKEGSLKSFATVLGTVYAVYLGIGNYGDFRQGISMIYDDCRRLAESVCNESLFQSKARNPEIIRIEARTGVIGSLRKIISDLDSLQRLNGQISAKEMAAKLEAIQIDAEWLISKLNSDEDKKFVAAQLQVILGDSPQSPAPSPRKNDLPEFVISYQNQRRRFFDSLKKFL